MNKKHLLINSIFVLILLFSLSTKYAYCHAPVLDLIEEANRYSKASGKLLLIEETPIPLQEKPDQQTKKQSVEQHLIDSFKNFDYTHKKYTSIIAFSKNRMNEIDRPGLSRQEVLRCTELAIKYLSAFKDEKYNNTFDLFCGEEFRSIFEKSPEPFLIQLKSGVPVSQCPPSVINTMYSFHRVAYINEPLRDFEICKAFLSKENLRVRVNGKNIETDIFYEKGFPFTIQLPSSELEDVVTQKSTLSLKMVSLRSLADLFQESFPIQFAPGIESRKISIVGDIRAQSPHAIFQAIADMLGLRLANLGDFYRLQPLGIRPPKDILDIPDTVPKLFPKAALKYGLFSDGPLNLQMPKFPPELPPKQRNELVMEHLQARMKRQFRVPTLASVLGSRLHQSLTKIHRTRKSNDYIAFTDLDEASQADFVMLALLRPMKHLVRTLSTQSEVFKDASSLRIFSSIALEKESGLPFSCFRIVNSKGQAVWPGIDSCNSWLTAKDKAPKIPNYPPDPNREEPPPFIKD